MLTELSPPPPPLLLFALRLHNNRREKWLGHRDEGEDGERKKGEIGVVRRLPLLAMKEGDAREGPLKGPFLLQLCSSSTNNTEARWSTSSSVGVMWPFMRSGSGLLCAIGRAEP